LRFRAGLTRALIVRVAGYDVAYRKSHRWEPLLAALGKDERPKTFDVLIPWSDEECEEAMAHGT
jgi:hypothetical protein